MSTVHTNPEIAYDQYDFQKTIITIDKHGNLDEVVSLDEKIKVSKDWRSFSEGNKPEDGYLSKGATKFAFMGRYKDAPYAIFQCKACPGVNEALNCTDLMVELKLLVHGQYFAESFAQHAQMYSVQIPGLDIHWNAHGAFIGTVTNAWLDDMSSLVFETFLVAPLLDMSDLYTERKSSGSMAAGHSIDVVGSAIDTYAHHVLVDSDGTLLLTDLQGMLQAKDTGFWDGGSAEIRAWQGAHKCKELCTKLKLKNVHTHHGPLCISFSQTC
ncbi:hypothetical protein L208DRAFT_1301371 [Tricholoma matsutake]|nr:hypothetical protein L208DRAFT_1301371 [Tricholoma matsutake 945]